MERFSLRKTCIACATISGPMPSPGRTAIFMSARRSEVPGVLRLALRLERADLVRVAQREPDLVEPVEQAVLAELVDVETEALRAIDGRDRLLLQINHQSKTGKRRSVVEELVDLGLRQGDRQEAVLQRVVLEDLPERRCDYGAEAVVAQRPRRVLARGADAEVLAREQDLRALVARLVEHELGVLAPRGEAGVAEAGALDRLQVLLRNDLVGVDVRAVERNNEGLHDGELVHLGGAGEVTPCSYLHVLTSTKCPAIAAAAAIVGLTRWVRPPTPWRPSKLRFEVEAQRSPASSLSGFMPRHIEQPGSRHSNPASRNTLSSPSFSACAFTNPDPGTTIASRMLEAILRPFTTAAAARRSSMRELVHEPMKILSSLMSVIRVRGLSPM